MEKYIGFRRIVFLCLMMLAISYNNIIFSQEPKVSLNALIMDVQKSTEDANEIIMVWWLPEEFWVVALSRDPSITKSQIDMITQTLKPYILLIVVEGTVGNFGGVTYESEATIRDHIEVVDVNGKTFVPINQTKIDVDTKNLLSMMKPVLANMLGPMGQNMHFLLFPSRNINKDLIADPTKKGMFNVNLSGRKFHWRLPLGSLLTQKFCISCNEKLSGAFNFCPFCGSKL